MIEYKILHIPTGAYVNPTVSFTSPRKAGESLCRFLEIYELNQLEVGRHYTDIILHTSCATLHKLYINEQYIPHQNEFEIIVVQTLEIKNDNDSK